MPHLPRLLACLGLVAACLPAQAESGRFSQGVVLGDAGVELRVAAATWRSDGRWLTLGSRIADDNRETPYLFLRGTDGTQLASFALTPGNGRSWAPSSLIEVGGGDLIVFGLEYDHTDFGAPKGLFFVRLDAAFQLVWSRHVHVAETTFASATLRAQTDGPLLIVGGIQPMVGGAPGSGDAFLATLDPEDGDLVGAKTLGMPNVHERGADVASLGDGRRALLLEVIWDAPGKIKAGDGLVALDASGAIASSRLSGHSLAIGERAAPMRLLNDGDGWIITGRLTGLPPNFFYLQRLARDLTPASTRTIIPFFNVADATAATGGGVLLYGEANGEVMDRGSVLMRLDRDLEIAWLRRYGTQNQSFPSGAIARGDGGLLLALGAMRDDDALVFESTHRVLASDGHGLLCDEGDYSGFTTETENPPVAEGWNPTQTLRDISSSAVSADVQPLTRSDVAECAAQDDLIFRDRFDPHG